MRNAAPSDLRAARIMKRIVPAFRQVEKLRCNACRKTCRISRQTVKPPWAPSSCQTRPRQSSHRLPQRPKPHQLPIGGTAALQCLEKSKAKVSSGCQQAINTASGSGEPAAATTVGPTTIPAAPPADILVLRPMRPREEIFILRSACGRDVRSLCGGVAPGGGRIIQCLATQAASLSSACKNVLSQFAAQ